MILLKDSYLTPPQFAKKCKLSRQRISVLINQKRIKPEPVRIGRFYFISKIAKIVK